MYSNVSPYKHSASLLCYLTATVDHSIELDDIGMMSSDVFMNYFSKWNAMVPWIAKMRLTYIACTMFFTSNIGVLMSLLSPGTTMQHL